MNTLRFSVLSVLLGLQCLWLAPAWANDPPKPADAKNPPAKEEKPAKDGAAPPAKPEKPTRTFEGQEPLFYFDANRRPYIEPFHKSEGEEYFVCRGVIGEWFRQQMAEEANMLAAKDDLDKVSGSTCAVRLVATNHGKKLPIVSVELYVNSNVMRSCILGDSCPQSRTIIMYVLDKTLYRSYFITDQDRKIRRTYCLDNKSKILAKKECWHHFFDKSTKEKSKDKH